MRLLGSFLKFVLLTRGSTTGWHLPSGRVAPCSCSPESRTARTAGGTARTCEYKSRTTKMVESISQGTWTNRRANDITCYLQKQGSKWYPMILEQKWMNKWKQVVLGQKILRSLVFHKIWTNISLTLWTLSWRQPSRYGFSVHNPTTSNSKDIKSFKVRHAMKNPTSWDEINGQRLLISEHETLFCVIIRLYLGLFQSPKPFFQGLKM